MAVTDIRVEVVNPGRRVGAFLDADLERLTEQKVRPVFKCELTKKHQDSLGNGITHVWVDCSQMGTDSGNVAQTMAYVARRNLGLAPGVAQELEALLNACLTVVGSDEDKGQQDYMEGTTEERKAELQTNFTTAQNSPDLTQPPQQPILPFIQGDDQGDGQQNDQVDYNITDPDTGLS